MPLECWRSRADLREKRVVRGEVDLERREHRRLHLYWPEHPRFDGVAGDGRAADEQLGQRGLDVRLERARREVKNAKIFEIALRAVMRRLDRVVRTTEDE